MEDIDHPKIKIKDNQSNYNWLPDFIYGGIDGAITTFAVVAGVVGASLSTTIILILGFANLFADGFSMATSKFLSDKSEKEQYDRIQKIEFRHLKEKTEHETQEVREILEMYGFKGKDLKKATKIITSNPKTWVDLMMKHEFNMDHESVKPLKGALITFCSFITIGFIPLVVYTFGPILKLDNKSAFLTTCMATLFALFLVGAIKSKFSTKNWIISGLQVTLIGGLAAGISYGVGFFLKNIVS